MTGTMASLEARRSIPSLSLLCWAYNEEESIGEFLEKASALMTSLAVDYEIILVDDGSMDRTYEIARAFQERCPRLAIIRHERNQNVMASFKDALQSARKEYVFWQTVDWSYDLSGLKEHIAHLGVVDVVAGARRNPVAARLGIFRPIATLLRLFGIQHLTRRSDSVPKAIVSIVNYILVRVLFGLRLSDYQNVMFFPTRWLQSIELEANSSFGGPELLWKAHWSGLSIQEVPINFIPRRHGIAKGTRIRDIAMSIKDIVRLWFRWVVLRRFYRGQPGAIIRLGTSMSGDG